MANVGKQLDHRADGQWSVTEARVHLSEIVRHAQDDGPQVITRRGKPIALVVPHADPTRAEKREGTLADFFARSPLRDVPDLLIDDR